MSIELDLGSKWSNSASLKELLHQSNSNSVEQQRVINSLTAQLDLSNTKVQHIEEILLKLFSILTTDQIKGLDREARGWWLCNRNRVTISKSSNKKRRLRSSN